MFYAHELKILPVRPFQQDTWLTQPEPPLLVATCSSAPLPINKENVGYDQAPKKDLMIPAYLWTY